MSILMWLSFAATALAVIGALASTGARSPHALPRIASKTVLVFGRVLFVMAMIVVVIATFGFAAAVLDAGRKR